MSLIQYRPGGGTGIVGTTKGTGGVGPQGATGPAGPAGGTDAYISAYSTSSQSFVDGGTAPADITHHAVAISNNCSLSGGNIQVGLKGVYKILFSVQYLATSGNGKLTIFLSVNGNPIANSSTTTHFNNNEEGVITVEYIESLNANDIISFPAYATSGTVSVFYTGATTVGGQTVPAGPGVITDVYLLRPT